MDSSAPSVLLISMLGMGVVFIFLVFLSAMMAILTAIAGDRKLAEAAAPEPAADLVGPGSPGWIASVTAAFLAEKEGGRRLPSAVAWRPYDTADAVRWRLTTP